MTSATKEFDRKPAKNIACLVLKFKRYKALLHGLILIFFIILLQGLNTKCIGAKKNKVLFLLFYLLNSPGFQAILGSKNTGRPSMIFAYIKMAVFNIRICMGF